jgi:squalene-associated FAD-dependent desaturase
VDDLSPQVGKRAGATRIAVVGGGWAGCAAAVTLADHGLPVTLVEQARVLGGRARRVDRGDVPVDNGQHLLLGAYRETLRLVGRVHGEAPTRSLYVRMPLALRPFGCQTNAPDLIAWRLPAPLHLAGAILVARGLDWRARRVLTSRLLALKRQRFRVPAHQDVAACFSDVPKAAFDAVLAPLCVAALNTLPEEASAQIFANVIREALFSRRAMSDFLLPSVDLSTLFPEAAARHVEARGGVVRTGAAVRGLRPGNDRIALTLAGEGESFAAAIVAVGPHQLASTLDTEAARVPACARALASVAAFRYESITTVNLAFAGPVAMRCRIERLDDAPGQWVFDRSDALPSGAGKESLLSVVISAHGPHDAMDHATLATGVLAQLRRLAPNLPPLAWSRVIAERRATYACTPGLERPAAGRIAPRLYLAGDYTDPGLPATIEAAVRSGVRAAQALLADLSAALPCP